MTNDRETGQSPHREFLVVFAGNFVSLVDRVVRLLLRAVIAVATAVVFFGWPLIVYVEFPGTLFAPPSMPPSWTFISVMGGWWFVLVLAGFAFDDAWEEVYG